MPAAAIQLYEDDDSTSAGVEAFGTVANGAESSAWPVHVWNQLDDATADTAEDVRIRVLASTDGGTTWSATHTAVADGWVQMQVSGTTEGSSNTISDQTTSYRPVTVTNPLLLDQIPSDCARHINVKIVMPSGAVGSSEVRLRLEADWASPFTTTGLGHYETGGSGVFHGLGDQAYTDLLQGGALTETGTPDQYTQVADLMWVHNGIPYVKLAHQIDLGANDGDAAALTAGNEYIATLSVGSSTTLTITRSSQGAAPLANSNRPAVPTGERLVGYVKRHFDAIINTSDISQAAADGFAYGFFYLETSGLTATIHRGTATVNNSVVRWTSSRNVTMTASETNTIYVQPNGTLENVVSGAAPTDGRSEAIWEVTTDGSGETARRDLRVWQGGKIHKVEFRHDGTISASDERHAMVPTVRDCYVLLPNPIFASLGTTGTTSGNTVWDIESSDAGAAFTTLFTSGATERPTIAYNASDPVDTTALPEVTTVPGGARLKSVADTIPGGSDSADGYLCLYIVEAGR